MSMPCREITKKSKEQASIKLEESEKAAIEARVQAEKQAKKGRDALVSKPSPRDEDQLRASISPSDIVSPRSFTMNGGVSANESARNIVNDETSSKVSNLLNYGKIHSS